MDITTYEQQVSQELERVYGVSWSDVEGGPDRLERAMIVGQTPCEFVEWYAAKYDLISIDESNGW